MFSEENNKYWTIIGIFILMGVFYLLAKHIVDIEKLLYSSGPLAPIIAVLLYPLLAPTPVTTDPITVIVGVVYGPFWGVAIAWTGNTMAAMVEYYMGGKIEKHTKFSVYKEKLPLGLGKLPVNSMGFLVLGRMIPGYGGKIISILAGVYRVPVKRYLWATAVTNLFGAILLAFGGFGLIKVLKISRLF